MEPLSYACTQNVRSIATLARLADFEASISKLKFSIFGLAETRRSHKECLQLGSGYILYNSGKTDGSATYAGVGFYLPQKLNKHVNGVYYISDRIIQLIIKGPGNRKIRLTQVHAPHSGQEIKINGTNIQKVNSFVYLGQLINQPNIPHNHNLEISRRIGAAWASFGKVNQLLTKKRVPMKVKHRYFQQCITPTLLYGCESWTLTKAMELRLARCQRAMERRMLNIRIIDKHSSKWIRQRTKLPDVNVEYRKRKWKHLQKIFQRKDQNRWDWLLLNWTPKSPRPLGRPRTRWSDCFAKVAGKSWLQKVNTPQWKDLFQPFINNICD